MNDQINVKIIKKEKSTQFVNKTILACGDVSNCVCHIELNSIAITRACMRELYSCLALLSPQC